MIVEMMALLSRWNWCCIILFGLLISAFGVVDSVSAATSPPQAQNGFLDLSAWAFQRDGALSLDGEWELYWERLLEPADFRDGDSYESVGLIRVPGTWNNDDSNLPNSSEGYATYRLSVRFGDNELNKVKALFIPNQSTAYRVWIDGMYMDASGVVGTSREQMIPKYSSAILPFTPERSIVEIVVQMSNFHHRVGGMWKSLKLGTASQILGQQVRRYAVDMIVFGIISILAIYQVAVYLGGRRGHDLLYLGLFGMAAATRTLVTSEHMIQWLLPNLPWEAQIKVEYLSTFLGLLAFTLFLSHHSPSVLHRSVTRCVALAVGAGSVVTVSTTGRTSSEMIPYFEYFLALYILYLIRMGLSAIRKRNVEWMFTVGMSLLLVTTLHDVLRGPNFGAAVDIFPGGVSSFLLLQSFALAKQFSEADYYSRTDFLINQPNRRELNSIMTYEFQRADRYDRPLAVILFDVDHFKTVNDTYGHEVGDEVLIEIARIVRSAIRATDIFGRWGGEEFLLLAPEASWKEGYWLAEKIRRLIEEHRFGHVGVITASFGVSVFQGGDTIERAISRTDEALYRSKDRGRNYVTLAEPHGSDPTLHRSDV